MEYILRIAVEKPSEISLLTISLLSKTHLFKLKRNFGNKLYLKQTDSVARETQQVSRWLYSILPYFWTHSQLSLNALLSFDILIAGHCLTWQPVCIPLGAKSQVWIYQVFVYRHADMKSKMRIRFNLLSGNYICLLQAERAAPDIVLRLQIRRL